MARDEVQPPAIGLGALGAGSVTAIWVGEGLPAIGWWAALAYLAVSTALLLRALRRRHADRLGWANVVTATRSALVGVITGLVVASVVEPIPVPLLVGLAAPALVLDAVDGWVARRTSSITELGARFDMEVDAFLLLVLSGFVAQVLGPWVLAIGLMRYAFVAAGWLLPWLRAQLPPRYWRKVVTAVQGIALTFAASGLAPALAAVLVAIALALLVESFARDVVWLAVRSRSDDLSGAGDGARPAEVDAS
jgi:phosphatidylglycerophosphate synthase